MAGGLPPLWMMPEERTATMADIETARTFVRKHKGKACKIKPMLGFERRGRIHGMSSYGTVVIEFEPYPEPSQVGHFQEWPVERIQLL